MDLFPDLEPRFRTTSIDIPWPERGGGKIKRGADRHYSLLDKPGCKTVPHALRVIRECPIWRPFSDAAHLYLWATDNYLEAGLWVIRELGFEFKRTFPWVKTCGADALDDLDEDDLRDGIGQYARGEHELMLFAVRGEGMSPIVYRPNRSIGSVIVAPHERDARGRRIHSRKPLASYERIEARSFGPYAEVFSRRGREGWTSWGNEYQSEDVTGNVAPER
jgi:N6-adenosine-specific RNA methylase IME4